MIVLPQTVRKRSTFRILVMEAGNWTTTPQPWTALPMPAIYAPATFSRMAGTVAQGGYHVGDIARWCLPDEDRAEFYIDTGLLNGVMVEADDLANHDVRIQVYDDESFPTEEDTSLTASKWKTVFVGTVIKTDHRIVPGGAMLGRTTYYCAGILWRTRNWPLNRHSTESASDCAGNPGYNIPLHGWFRKVLGNRDSDPVTIDINGDLVGGFASFLEYYMRHRLPVDGGTTLDSAKVWTDEDVVKHALVSSRAAGEPVFTVDLSNGLFSDGLPWGVGPNEACWSLLARVCNRQRGRGAVFVTYTDDQMSGDVALGITCIPSNADQFGYRRKASYQSQSLDTIITVPGTEVGSTAVEVDLVGDHRLEGPVQWEDRYASVFDHIVVQGEPIQVLCNLNSFGGSLEKRWSTQDQTDFEAIPVERLTARNSPRWRHVWRRFGFSQSTGSLSVKAEQPDSFVSINYKTNSLGTIVSIGTSGNDARTSEMSLKFLPDLPIYEGWRYDGAQPVRWDAATDYLPPGRMPPVVMLEADKSVGSDIAWIPLTSWGYGLQADDFGFLLVHSLEDQYGTRLLSPTLGLKSLPDAGIDGVKAPLSLNSINTVAGVELGARVSMSVGGSYEDAGRRMVMTVSGLHLWLGAPGAIWELDYTRAAVGNYSPGLKFPAGNPYIIRDDRDQLAFITALAAEYYLVVHNPATWSLKDCGLLTSFALEGGDTVKYPTLGQMVKTITVAGIGTTERKITLNTNITCIHYDNATGVTTWRTDFVSYDGNIQ